MVRKALLNVEWVNWGYLIIWAVDVQINLKLVEEDDIFNLQIQFVDPGDKEELNDAMRLLGYTILP